MSASNDDAQAQGERMIRLEDELESFLEATQDPAAWLMVCAAKGEIDRLRAALQKIVDHPLTIGESIPVLWAKEALDYRVK
jgi:hypothetical protein